MEGANRLPRSQARGMRFVLGFGHLARRFRRLDEGVVRPIIENALADANPYIRVQADAAADDMTHFLGWRVTGRSEP